MFPLIVWEQTEEFKTILREAEEKKKQLIQEWNKKYRCRAYVGPIEPNMNENCEPVFWINDLSGCRFNGIRRNWSVSAALQDAMTHAEFGWCTLTDLELFLDGKGPLLEKAMKACGFRRHKRHPDQWARIRESDKDEAWQKKLKEEEAKKWPLGTPEELEKLNQLWLSPNGWAGLNRTFSIQSNKNGMLYIYLEVNPFSASRTEQLGQLGEMIRTRGHITKKQEGFSFEAKNMTLGKEKVVYIEAIRTDGTEVECVLPHYIPRESLSKLAVDLIKKVKGQA